MIGRATISAPANAPMPADQTIGTGAATVDDLGDAGAAERADGRVGREAAAAPRPFRIPILLVAQVLGRHRIAGALREGGAMGGRIGDEDEAEIERQVQPFVAVGRPGVGLVRAVEQVAIFPARRHPQAERAIDMDPGVVFVRDPAECGTVPVGGLVQLRIARGRIKQY